MTDTATDDVATAEPPRDEARDAVLATLAEALGDKIVEHHLHVGRDLWVRVDRRHWQDAGMAVRRAGFSYFGFLSVIDWMDSPDGRYENTEFDAAPPDPTDVEAGGEDAPAALDGEPPGDEQDVAEVVGEDPPADGDDPDVDAGDGSAAAVPTADRGPQRRAGGETRFQAFARVQQPGTRLGVTLKADLPDDDLAIETWIDIYPGANWHEREAWEMFGVTFVGHPDLRHIYLPGEFEGHPLRKDYPLLARVVKPWPGVVDIEEIPAELEEQLEAEVMAAFEAEQAGGEG